MSKPVDTHSPTTLTDHPAPNSPRRQLDPATQEIADLVDDAWASVSFPSSASPPTLGPKTGPQYKKSGDGGDDRARNIHAIVVRKTRVKESSPSSLIIEAQKKAIQELVEDLLNPDVSTSKLSALVRDNISVIKGNSQKGMWIFKVFDAVSTSGWPLLLLLFKEHIPFPLTLSPMVGFDQLKIDADIRSKWEDLLGKAVLNCIDNPSFSPDEPQPLKILLSLYSVVAKDPGIARAVIQFVMRNAPREKFILIMNQLSCGAQDTKEFITLLARSLETSGIKKTQFIIDCLNGFFKQKDRPPTQHPGVKLEDKFWKEPFLKTPEELKFVSVGILNEIIDLDFLNPWSNQHQSTLYFIQSVRKTDQMGWEMLFCHFTYVLIGTAAPPLQKLVLIGAASPPIQKLVPIGPAVPPLQKLKTFENLFSEFVRMSSLEEMVEILTDPDLEDSFQKIRNWYSCPDIEKSICYSLEGFTLIRLFRPTAFFPSIRCHFEQILNGDNQAQKIDQFLEMLDQLRTKKDFLEQL